jgi:hypothetical protein
MVHRHFKSGLARFSLAAALTSAVAAAAAPPSPPCPSVAPLQTLGTIRSPHVAETSGIAASRQNPGVLWLHNDSGDRPRIFAVSTDGALRATYEVKGATAVDWEDMTLGPGPRPGIDYLYVGDIGNNKLRRRSVTVYRFPEPRLREESRMGVTENAEALQMRYPDRAHDAEALLSDPRSGDLYIVSKASLDDGPTLVFRAPFPHQPGKQIVLEQVASLELAQARYARTVTAGDISPKGDMILLRTYTQARIWRRPRGVSIAQALADPPCRVPVAPVLAQDEAITFRPDGGGYFTVREGPNPPIHWFEIGALNGPRMNTDEHR